MREAGLSPLLDPILGYILPALRRPNVLALHMQLSYSLPLVAASALALTLGGRTDDEAPPATGPDASTPAPLTKVIAIGASVTAGYGNAAELKTDEDVPLSEFLSCAFGEGTNGSVAGDGDRWFFASASTVGEKQVDDALDAAPSLVVGVDFLFWYAFGRSTKRDPRREKGLEEGLAQLDRLGGPLVIGDLPDISHALDGKGPFGGPLVTPDLFPTDEERTRMNARIREWARARGDVALVPLAEMTANMVSGRPISVQDRTWAMGALQDALQRDLLHPHVHGSIWVAMLVADAATRLDGIEPGAFLWDPEAIRERLDRATESSRQARLEKERQRAERRERRQREKRGGEVPLRR